MHTVQCKCILWAGEEDALSRQTSKQVLASCLNTDQSGMSKAHIAAHLTLPNSMS